MNKHHNGIWIAYILSCFTPFTFLISGVIAIIYAGYRLDKGEDSDVVISSDSYLLPLPDVFCGADCHRSDL